MAKAGAVTIIDLENKDSWEKAIEGIPHTFAHTWEYNYAMSKNFKIPVYLFVYVKDDAKIICPIIEREFNGYLDVTRPFGISGFTGNKNMPQFYKEWFEFVKRNDYVCGYLTLNPYDVKRFFRESETEVSNYVYVLGLQKGENELISGMSKGRREQLRKFGTYEKKIISDKEEIIKFFKYRYEDNLKSLGASNYYYLTDEAIDIIGYSNRIEMIAILENNDIVSTIVFSINNKLGELHYKITLPEFRNHSVHLDWAAIKKIKERGCNIVGLGGDVGSEGLAKYKYRFGAQTIPVKHIKHVYNGDLYQDLCDQFVKDSSGNIDINYFPKYHG